MSAGLVVRGLRAGYGETVVLDGISIDLPAEGALAVLGRNGVGKTTLLATLMGHTTLHGGSIRWRGTALDALTPHRRARLGLGYVPQEREVFRSLSVEENLTVGRQPGPWSLERVYAFFPRLAERRRHYGNQLSGGEQQMLAIGRALMLNPTLLLLDEPLEGLAPVIVDLVLAGIEQLKRAGSLGILLVEQHARLALAVTDRALVLDRGTVVHLGESDALLREPGRLASLMGVAKRI